MENDFRALESEINCRKPAFVTDAEPSGLSLLADESNCQMSNIKYASGLPDLELNSENPFAIASEGLHPHLFPISSRDEPADSGVLFTRPFTGLMLGAASTLGMKSVMDKSLYSLPIPAPARLALSIGTALIVGGMMNNKFSGADMLSSKGFLVNTAVFGLGYGGVRLRGF